MKSQKNTTETTTRNYFNWDVVERDVFFAGDNGEPVAIPNKKALVRDDNDFVLSVMSGAYSLLTNEELTTIGQIVSENQNSELVKTFTGKQGKVVCLQIKLPQNITIANDDVEEYVTLMNGHDGKGALSIGFSNKVMSCANQYFAFKKMQKFSVWHSKNMHDQIDQVLAEVENIKNQRDELNRKFRKFADIKIANPRKEAIKMVKYIAGIDLSIPAERLHEEFKLSKAAVTKAGKMLEVTMSEMDQKGQTLWGLFNGATYYANHHISTKEPEANLVYGRGAKINAMAMDYATALM